jgi:transcriptional regulator with XRE-family HTH domain
VEASETSSLKEARLDHGWTQTQLASMIGVSDRAYRAWENGDAYPSDLPLRRLAKVFGKKPEELGLEKKPTQPKTSPTYATLSQALQELVERNTQWAEAGIRTDAEKERMVNMIRQLLLEIEAGKVDRVAERFDQVMLAQSDQSDSEEEMSKNT